MRIDCALLCDAASVREGLLHILGGGIARAARPTFPAPLGMMLALRILAHPTEADHPHGLKVVVNGAVGQQIAAAEMTMGQIAQEVLAQLTPGEEISVPIALNLTQVFVPSIGTYSVEVLIDGLHQASLPFNVKQGLTI
jgi:hypothetical protein